MPQFPLQLVVYPGEALNLHIFEPRYRQLINEVHASGETFGIPAFIDKEIMEIGTEVRLLSIEKTFESGEMDVKTVGVGIYQINEFYDKAPDKLYAGAETEKIEIEFETDVVLATKVREGIRKLYQILEINRTLPEELSDFQTYDLAHHIGCNLEQEYDILTIPDEYGRLEYVMEHLEKLLPIVEEAENLRRKVQMNGHFKNLLPPEF